MEEIAPEAVGQAAGEQRVLGRGQPLRVRFAAILADGQFRFLAAEKAAAAAALPERGLVAGPAFGLICKIFVFCPFGTRGSGRRARPG